MRDRTVRKLHYGPHIDDIDASFTEGYSGRVRIETWGKEK